MKNVLYHFLPQSACRGRPYLKSPLLPHVNVPDQPSPLVVERTRSTLKQRRVLLHRLVALDAPLGCSRRSRPEHGRPEAA